MKLVKEWGARVRFLLHVDYPLEEVEASRRRMIARFDFKYVERIP